MSDFTDEWFKDELARLRGEFELGKYPAFMEALLLCCWNKWPLPDWVAAIVIQQAEDAFNRQSTGPGRHGNWKATYTARQIDERRYALANLHLSARRRKGRGYVSELARAYGYGTPAADSAASRVTRDDIFQFVSKQLAGTPAQGSERAVEDSYKRVKRGAE